MQPRSASMEQFWANVDRSGGPAACWEWTSSRNWAGYGHFRYDGECRAHRWLLGRLRGSPLVRGENALHKCDNPPCCNPAHLYVGSQSANILEAVAHRRHPMTRKTHCPQGHAYSTENTYVHRNKRYCRACIRARKAAARRAA
jgi:hypothetical protein